MNHLQCTLPYAQAHGLGATFPATVSQMPAGLLLLIALGIRSYVNVVEANSRLT